MREPSQQFAFDSRLLAIEELFRQRQFEAAYQELDILAEQDFVSDSHEAGLYFTLQADRAYNSGDYRQGIKVGQRAAKILASLPLNRRYAKVLLILSKTYNALGDFKIAEIKAHDALAAYRRAGDPDGQVDALNELASIAFIRSDYAVASDLLEEAIKLAVEDERRCALLTGNAGRVRTLNGEWAKAEDNLTTAIKYDRQHGSEISLARNLLSLGYLHLMKREFLFAQRSLDEAQKLIEAHDLVREKIILSEYLGELAAEKGDVYKAKSILGNAYHEGRLLAPDSALVSQSGRRLAEVEYVLDNYDEAMKYGQKALDVAHQMGEQAEISMAHRVIALVFQARSENSEAVEHIKLAVETAREAGDPLVLARVLLSCADILMNAEVLEPEKVRSMLDEAARMFRKLKSEYWVAETDFRAGVLACQCGDLSRGFKKLSRSERAFNNLGDAPKVRRVSEFLKKLSNQAVALSVSGENEYKVFGNLINQSDLKDVKTGRMDDVLEVLMRRTSADRAIIYTPDFEGSPVISSLTLSKHQVRKFAEGFCQMLGQEISNKRPTLLLDCRRDPYVNDLLPDIPDVVASIIVVPFRMSDESTSFMYLDKLSVDNTLNPFSQSELNFAVGFSDLIAFKSAELQKILLQEDNRRLKAQLQAETAFPNIITCNKQMLEMLAQVRQVVDSSISIGIEGETGSGKDLLARAIHYNSVRRDKRFISVNCAALPETLLESELFGARRGAFTGADRDKPGLFEEADGGTFFLDEIADMPPSIQAKLLRVLEEKEVVRLGETVPRKVDVRIVSATNKDLKELMASGLFRSDLYYRLSALTFRLPPLRERREDIPLLVEKFLEGSGKSVSGEVIKKLIAYDWPGNVRELENEVKKLVLLAGGGHEIGLDVMSSKLFSVTESAEPSLSHPAAVAPDGVTFTHDYSLYDYLAAHERQFIVRALRERKGVKKHAAEALSIPESTLRLKIKQYCIDLDRLDAIN
ncbi:MAG: sigma 54-interacting transcriptional regulator [Candidatus Zixiibacteriota bacterium]|nr:MAG: sigma 54-interacting transcriptional regulator [candidate division Zixibacteria bacterium]